MAGNNKQQRPFMPTLNSIRSSEKPKGYDVAEALDSIADSLAQTNATVAGLSTGVTQVTTQVQQVAAAQSSTTQVQTQSPDVLGFDAIESGTNIQATMVVDTGATLTPADDGVVGANELFNTSGAPIAPISGTAPTHPGEVLISQPDGSAAFADPLVQGLYAEGSSITTPPPYTTPTTIQPVLTGVSASDKLYALRTCDTFKTYQTAGGSSLQVGIWTPASGNAFRLMKLRIDITGDATSASPGLMTIYLTDGPAGPVVGWTFDIYIPPYNATNVGGYFSGVIYSTDLIDFGNGYLSTGANTTLYLNANVLLATGKLRINVAGTEE